MNETLYPDIRIYLICIMITVQLIFCKVFEILVSVNDSIIYFFKMQFDSDLCIIWFHTWIKDFTHCAPWQKKDKYPLIFYNGKILPCCNNRFKGDHFLHYGSPWYPHSPFADGPWVLFKLLLIYRLWKGCELSLRQ